MNKLYIFSLLLFFSLQSNHYKKLEQAVQESNVEEVEDYLSLVTLNDKKRAALIDLAKDVIRIRENNIMIYNFRPTLSLSGVKGLTCIASSTLLLGVGGVVVKVEGTQNKLGLSGLFCLISGIYLFSYGIKLLGQAGNELQNDHKNSIIIKQLIYNA